MLHMCLNAPEWSLIEYFHYSEGTARTKMSHFLQQRITKLGYYFHTLRETLCFWNSLSWKHLYDACELTWQLASTPHGWRLKTLLAETTETCEWVFYFTHAWLPTCNHPLLINRRREPLRRRGALWKSCGWWGQAYFRTKMTRGHSCWHYMRCLNMTLQHIWVRSAIWNKKKSCE